MTETQKKFTQKVESFVSTMDLTLLSNKFHSLIENKVFIYGAGNMGTATCQLLQKVGINVAAFFDRCGGNAATHLNKRVFKIEEHEIAAYDRKKDIIVIAFICSSEQLQTIKRQLIESGYENIISFYDIYGLLITNKLTTAERTDMSSIAMNQVIKTAGLWDDSSSRNIYHNYLKAVLSANPGLFSAMIEQPQYFVNDIPFKMGYSRFVDCGAFDGDTALSLSMQKGKAQSIACFEPDSQNFIKLCSNLRKQRVAAEQILFPCGVWEMSEMLRFRSGVQSTSGISEAGDTYIQCVAIDDVIPDFNPTFIKMDVEGAEYEALLGAQKTIQGSAPDLAISVYHRIEHMWEIPLLVQSINPNYKFYLRSHGSHNVETIMYATQK